MKGNRQVNDAFSKRHPAVNFVFFLGVIVASALIQHPAYVLAGFVTGAIYYLLLNGSKGLKFLLLLLPLFVFVEGGERRSAWSPLGLCHRLTLGAIISLNSITAKKLTADC